MKSPMKHHLLHPIHQEQHRRHIKLQHHKEENAVRHAEKRRTGTCSFSDRVANISIEHYCATVPLSFRESQKQTCIATILVHFKDTDTLQVLALGAGTKFLPFALLQDGKELHRLRDCHAEVLCKRAFRRYLFHDLLMKKRQAMTHQGLDGNDLRSMIEEVIVKKSKTSIEILNDDSSSETGQKKAMIVQYRMKEGVTLHLYCSSAPCGNATLKKFAKMTRETYNFTLAPHEWEMSQHVPIRGHAIPFGQFALTVKLDRSIVTETNGSSYTKHETTTTAVQHTTNETNVARKRGVNNKKLNPAQISDEWCPPGTSTVTLGKGSIHTCSDKICRWNFLGLQGGLLSSFIPEPIYLTTITIARKFTRCICERALCCRAAESAATTTLEVNNSIFERRFKWNHPTIMGTGVYLDKGVLEMKQVVIEGETVKFESKLAWAWSPGMGLECIDGASGLVYDFEANGIDIGCEKMGDPYSNVTEIDFHRVSQLSSVSFADLHNGIEKMALGATNIALERERNWVEQKMHKTRICSLSALRDLKRQGAPLYEDAKDRLLKVHPIFRDWKRREIYMVEVARNPEFM